MATTDRTLFGRAAANLARGIGGSLPLAVLPPLLARQLGDDEFAVWVVIVQFASYVAYLEFGVQTAVSKTVAAAYATSGLASTRASIGAGVQLLTVGAVAGVVLVGATSGWLSTIFDLPEGLDGSARSAFLALGVAAAIALPSSALHGALLGIGRNDLSAFVVVATRLPSVFLTVVGASLGWSITQLAIVLGLGSIANAGLSVVVSRSIGLPLAVDGGREERREIVGLTATFGLFTVATLLVTGVDVVVVGAVDFDDVAPYALGASLVAVATAGYALITTVLLPAFADAAARGELDIARNLVIRSTALSSWLLAIGLTVAVSFEPLVMSVWAGEYADESGLVFVVLMGAAAVRLSVSPLSQFIVGVGEHRRARIPAAMEASLNLALSIVLGLWIGAPGVALATLIAAVVAVSYYLIRLAPATLGPDQTKRLVIRSFAVPVVVVGGSLPLILLRRGAITWIITAVVIAIGVRGIREIRRIGTSPATATAS